MAVDPFTAHFDHPTGGATSAGVILRVNIDGTRHPNYGDDGVWVTPRTPKLRPFVAAGTWPGGAHPGGVVGVRGSEMVAVGVAPDAKTLNTSFGVKGILRRSLGGALSSPVTASYGQYIYLFAARDDGKVVGCRFNRQGVLDTGFGDAGVATIPSGAEELTLADIKVNGTRLAITVTRGVDGVNCDWVPAIVVLNPATGQPDATFGAGGLAFHAAVDEPAVVCPDGVAYYGERRALGGTATLRRTDPDGRFERAITPGVAAGYSEIRSLYALDDSSLLVAGVTDRDWICKLTPQGDLDMTFGTGGVAFPRPGIPSLILNILGVRPDGTIALQFDGRFGILEPNGALDSTWGPPDTTGQGLDGLVETPGYSRIIDTTIVNSTATPFLDADGSILCLISSTRPTTAHPAVWCGLRRINPDGYYDPAFGLGEPSLRRLETGQAIAVTGPFGIPGGEAGSRRAL